MGVIDTAKQLLAARRTAYVRTFSAPAAEAVLADLYRFCRMGESCFHPDARMHAVAEGRREVGLRIQRFLNLSDDELWQRYGRPEKPTE